MLLNFIHEIGLPVFLFKIPWMSFKFGAAEVLAQKLNCYKENTCSSE